MIENKHIAREFIEQMFNKGNVENADRFVTSDFIYPSQWLFSLSGIIFALKLK
jgi:predicted SnoaL-like aldol condensation-catalyzing enzyme